MPADDPLSPSWLSGGERRESMGWPLAFAIVLHLAPLSWLVWQYMGTRPAMRIENSAPIAVELAPMSAAAPAPQDLRIDDKSQRQVTPSVQQPTVAPDTKVIDKTVAAPDADVVLRERTKTITPVAPRPAVPQQATAQPQAPAPQPPSKSAAPLAGASPSATTQQQNWEAAVVAAIERAKRYPAGAQWARQEDTVLVRLAISHGGMVSGVKILRSAHYDQLDAEAKSVVQRVTLPSPPASIAEDPVVITVPIQFYLQRK